MAFGLGCVRFGPQFAADVLTLKVREVIRLLREAGWIEDRRSGSHRQFIHPTRRGGVTVSGHDNDEVPPGTLRSIYRQAALDWGHRP